MAFDPKKTSRKLVFDDAVEVWRRRRRGHLQHHIAAHLGVNQGRISEILTGKLHPKSRDAAMRMR